MWKAFTAALIMMSCVAAARGEAPHIGALDPAQGPITGGTLVTVTGAGFGGATVTLDGAPIVASALSDTLFQFTTPRRDNGYALLQVTAAGGSAAAEYLYVPPRLEDLPPGYITTVAGAGRHLRLGLPAKTAGVVAAGIAVDADGNIYFAGYNRILKVRTDGILEPFAGDGTFDSGPNGDGGPATAAWISFCRTVSFDAAGNAYIPDESNRIRRVDAKTGIITTIAGTGEPGFSGDGGPAKDAQINQPNYLAAAPDGTVYFIDHRNARIRKIATDGKISTIAGTGVSGDSGDGGPATQAQLEMRFGDENGIAFDPRGFLYYVEYLAGKIRRIDLTTGIITTFFAGRTPDIAFVKPWALAVDPAGNVYAGSQGQIVKLDPGGNVLASWGAGFGYSEDGTPIDKMLIGQTHGLALERDGNILFSDVLVARLRRINLKTGTLETVAGIAPAAEGVPGPAVGAPLDTPSGDLAFLPSGDLLFGDATSIRIFRIDRAGQISIFGGTGMYFGGDCNGRPIDTCVLAPVALEPDGRGGLFISDGAEIIYMEPGGMTHRIVGPEPGYSGDGGPASQARLTQPWDLALDRDGNLLIADTNNNRIRRIDAKTGIITTIAGSGPSNGFEGYGKGGDCGDGGPALEACLNTPYALAVDPDGSIFINDFHNGRLRKVDTQGTIRTFGNLGSFGKLLADGYGGIFFHAHNVVRRFLPDGSYWHVAGSGERGFSGDGGPATLAKVSDSGAAIAADRDGNLFFHDVQYARIRAVRFGAVLAPPNPQVQATLGSGQSAPLTQAFGAPLEVSVRTSSGAAAPGVRVDFAAPAGGASAVFPNFKSTYSALTDRSGRARAPFQASCQAGRYTVAATALGSGKTASFSLSNTPVTNNCTADACVSVTPSQIAASGPTTVQIDVVYPQGGLLGATASYNGQDMLQGLLPYITEVTGTSARVVIPNLVFPSGTNAIFALTLETTQGSPSACLQIQVP